MANVNIQPMTAQEHNVITEINRACEDGKINWMRRQELVLLASKNVEEARIQLYIETGEKP